MDQELLLQLQETETEILNVVHEFCVENDIPYSLYAGTALGAVRHQGFIPWDDDIDICMERKVYDRFLRLWREKSPAGYYLQGTDVPDYTTINHTKIRKDNTALATAEEYAQPGHHGIWVDVFAIDKIPTDPKLKKQLHLFAKLRLIYTRGYPVTKGGAGIKLLSRILLMIPRKTQLKLRNWCEKKVVRYQDLAEGYEWQDVSSQRLFRFVYPAGTMEELIDVPFGKYQFKLHKEYHQVLTIQFGDYMKFPPKEEQVCRHTPEVIRFDKD